MFCASQLAVWMAVMATSDTLLRAQPPALPKNEDAFYKACGQFARDVWMLARATHGVLVVNLEEGVVVTMTNKKPLQSIKNEIAEIILVEVHVSDSTKIIVTGKQCGVSRLTLKDPDGTQEVYAVVVAKRKKLP
jgi:hypothetical protein